MNIWGAIGGWATAIVAIYGLFLAADKKLRPEIRLDLSNWLRGKKNIDVPWANQFIEIFDSVFKVKFFRVYIFNIPLPNVFVSIAASLLAVSVTAFFWVGYLPTDMTLGLARAVPPNELIQYDLTFSINGETINRVPIDLLIGSPLLINLIPDYISLVETRIILARMAKSRTLYGCAFWILTDAIITLIIAFCAFVLMAASAMAIFRGVDWGPAISDWVALFPSKLMIWESYRTIEGWFIYSTFLTSVWLWLYIASSLLIRLTYLVPYFVGLVNRVFDLDDQIDKKPLAILGYVLIGGITIITVIGLPTNA